MLRGFLVAATLAGCYSPPERACGITCDTECPGDLQCLNHVCVLAGGEPCDAPAIGFTQFSVGGRHACGIDADGQLFCWGDNRARQLGGMMPQLARPTRIDDRTWTMVAAGGAHTCGLSAGVAYCWGDNAQGQAAGMDGGIIEKPQAVSFGIASPPPFTKIAAGGSHSCALGEGQLFCWGDDRFLGLGASVNVATRIPGEWSDVALGADFGCAIGADGVMCWGSNDDAQAGLPMTNGQPTPRMIAGLPSGTVLSLEAGSDNACAVIATTGGLTGELWCWGDGKILGGARTVATAPTRLGSDTAWTRAAVGDTEICGLLRGNAYCWGETGSGLLGAGLWTEDRPQADATNLGPADEIDLRTRPPGTSADHFACMRTGGELRCWGDNSYGELGLGVASWFPTPVEVPAPTGRRWAHVRSGSDHSCAILDDGSVQCWGRNDSGSVDPDKPRGRDQPCTTAACDVATPVVAPVPMADEVMAGVDFTCARTNDTIRCWGDNRDNRLGAPNVPGYGPTTLTAPGGATFTRLLVGGSEATCAHLDSNKIACWGNIAGVVRTVPTVEPSPFLFDIGDVGIGDKFVCAVRNDDTRVCWGANTSGQIGNGGTTSVTAPTEYASPPLLHISARRDHACAVTEGLNIACWGANEYQQGGVDDMTMVTSPTLVRDASTELEMCSSVAVAERHSCAVCNKTVLCWGEDTFGQLGRGELPTSTAIAAPIDVDPALAFTEVSALETGGCALTATGRLFCWGDSWHGQIGTGGSAKNLPTPVLGAL